MADTAARDHAVETIDRVIIRFAGDSGDGMQLTGDRFTSASALWGNDLSTLPDFPAEIRAPAGTLAGVSAFQVHISDHEITTPGDAPNVLVCMNPAALKAELGVLEPGGTLIINTDAFTERNLAKAGYEANPLEGDDLKGYTVYEVPMTTITKESVADLGVKPRDAERRRRLERDRGHRDLEDVERRQRPVGERVAVVAGLLEVALVEGVAVHDHGADAAEALQLGLERGGVHRHEHVGLVARREDVVVADVDLERRDAGERAGRGTDLGRVVGQRREVVAEDGGDAGESVAGQLHAIAGVTREADDDLGDGLQLDRPLRGVGHLC